MPIKKIWDHVINIKKEFVLKKKKVYLLSREEKKEVYKFIDWGKGILDSKVVLKNTSVFCRIKRW